MDVLFYQYENVQYVLYQKIKLNCIKYVKGIDYMNDMVYKIIVILKE